MGQPEADTMKKAAFLHDVGKILNWSGSLHLLDGARVLKHLGFEDTVVGVALYHEPVHRKVVQKAIQHPDCTGLKAYADYDEYALQLGELVDRLMAGFDRMGKGGRHRPVVLRNPLTHLPMDGALRQFEDAINRQDCSGTDETCMREFVRANYLPGADLKPLDAQPDDCVYVLDDTLKQTPLLRPLVQHAANHDDFNTLYRTLNDDPLWATLTRRLIPQGHHPPTDTLALWYHMQFASAMTGLYWAEGFHSLGEVNDELKRLGKEPLEVKVGLLYVHLAGLNDYFATAYRLPDFTGTQKIAEALKRAVKQQLLDAEHNGDPFIWEDSFLYTGHDDFLVMVPVEETGIQDSGYAVQVDRDDPFRVALEEALSTSAVIARAVEDLLSATKLPAMLGCAPDNPGAFGDGRRLQRALTNLVSVKSAERCFAQFKDGSELTPLFGTVWNRLRAEGRGRVARSRSGVRYYAGDICDGCRANLAGHDPDPADPRDWGEVDWDRDIVRDEDWPPEGLNRRHLHYWIFRSESPEPGEGDKLCHACLLRRMLGSGTSLEELDEEEGQGRIAMIKGNVNRTLWYVGGSLSAEGPVSNEKSVYDHVWREEIARPILEDSREKIGSVETERMIKRVREQALAAAGNGPKLDVTLDLSHLGLSEDAEADQVLEFMQRDWEEKGIREKTKEFEENLTLEGRCYDPREGRWRTKGAWMQEFADPEVLKPDWLSQAQEVLREGQEVNQWNRLWDRYPNPWAPYPLSPAELDDLVFWLLSGTPHFIEDNEDLPTPSRTMTVSWMIDDAMTEVHEVVPEDVGDVVYADGDEFLIVCRAEEAPQLARRILRRVVARLNSVPESQSELLSDFLPVTVAMGVVAAKRKHPMYGLLEVVDRLMRNTKQAHPSNDAIDFENVVGGVDEAHLDRGSFTGAWLSQRPLTLRGFGSLIDHVESLEQGGFPATQLHQIAALIADVLPPRADRQTAALAYAWQPHEDDEWAAVRDLCATGRFQDLMTLWRWPQREEESEDARTEG